MTELATYVVSELQDTIAPEIAAAQEDLQRLGDRIVGLSAQIQVATHHLLLLIREFDERGGWGGGFRSCAHWLNLSGLAARVELPRQVLPVPGMRCQGLRWSSFEALGGRG